MKSINVSFENKEYEKLLKSKPAKKSWHDFILDRCLDKRLDDKENDLEDLHSDIDMDIDGDLI